MRIQVLLILLLIGCQPNQYGGGDKPNEGTSSNPQQPGGQSPQPSSPTGAGTDPASGSNQQQPNPVGSNDPNGIGNNPSGPNSSIAGNFSFALIRADRENEATTREWFVRFNGTIGRLVNSKSRDNTKNTWGVVRSNISFGRIQVSKLGTLRGEGPSQFVFLHDKSGVLYTVTNNDPPVLALPQGEKTQYTSQGQATNMIFLLSEGGKIGVMNDPLARVQNLVFRVARIVSLDGEERHDLETVSGARFTMIPSTKTFSQVIAHPNRSGAFAVDSKQNFVLISPTYNDTDFSKFPKNIKKIGVASRGITGIVFMETVEGKKWLWREQGEPMEIFDEIIVTPGNYGIFRVQRQGDTVSYEELFNLSPPYSCQPLQPSCLAS